MFSDLFKDYVTEITTYAGSTDSAVGNFLIGNIAFFWQGLVSTVTSIVTFQWLSHVHELPILLRESYVALIEGRFIARNGLVASPDFYTMLTTQYGDSKNLITGLFNGLFLALPCTLPQILALRAVVLNGWPPALAMTTGAAAGTSLYLAIVLFGFDGVTELMSDWHPLLLAWGLARTVEVASRAARSPDWAWYGEYRSGWWYRPHLWDDRARAVNGRYFRGMMSLGFFENHAIGHYFGNLTVTPSPSVLETSETWWLFDTTGYWLGLTVGMVVWSALVLRVWTVVYPWIVDRFEPMLRLSYRAVDRAYHRLTIVGGLVLALHAVPYYGADYLASGPFGLTYQDHLLRIDGAATRMIHMENTYDIENTDIEPDEMILDNVSFHDDTLTYFDRGLAITEGLPLEVPTLWPENLWFNRYVRDEAYEELARAAKGKPIPELTTYKRHYNPNNIDFPRTMNPGLDDPNEFVEEYDTYADEDEEEDENELFGIEILEEDALYNFRPDGDGGDYMDVLACAIYRNNAYTLQVDHSDTETPDWMDGTVRLFRERAYNSPIFKSLVRLETYSFVRSQPKAYHVDLHDDVALNKQRVVLSHYLTSLQNYKHRRPADASMSFAVRPVNQQFKGTLTHMRHYDAVRVFYPDPYRDDVETATDGDNTVPQGVEVPGEKVLSYDQPLYNRWHDTADAVLHEELMPMVAERQDRAAAKNLHPDRDAYRMQTYAAGPMYFGWDASARKLMINASRLPVPGKDGGVVHSPAADTAPPYFKFQAYPEAVHDDCRQYTLFDLTLQKDRPYLNRLRMMFGFFAKDPDEDFPEWVFEPSPPLGSDETYDDEAIEAEGPTAAEHREILRRLPQYDWHWKRMFLANHEEDVTDDDEAFAIRLARRPYFEMGRLLPPKLDGVAWPGVLNNGLEMRYAQRKVAYYGDRSPYPTDFPFGGIPNPDKMKMRYEPWRYE